MQTEMEKCEQLAKQLAGAREELSIKITDLRDEQEAAKRRRITGIKNSAARFRQAFAELMEFLRANPGLFEKPKTRTLHGIRLGWMKQPGRLEWEDGDAVVAAIRKLFGEDASEFLNERVAPNRDALSKLTVDKLKRLGVRVTADSDKPVIKLSDDEIDKLVAALVDGEDAEELAP